MSKKTTPQPSSRPIFPPKGAQCRAFVASSTHAEYLGVGLGSPRNHFLRLQGRSSSTGPTWGRRASVRYRFDDVSDFGAAAVRPLPGGAGRRRTVGAQRIPEHRLPQLHRRLAAFDQQVDHAAAETWRKAILLGDILQGELLSCNAVLQVPWHASGEYHVAGRERQVGEIHQRFRSGPRTLLDLGHRPGGRRPLLLDVNRKAHNFHQLERGRTQQLPI